MSDTSPSDLRQLLKAKMLAPRAYLSIPRISHRHAVARLLAGIPPYAVELLRYENIPHEWRLCRFCRSAGIVEDELHILFDCTDPVIDTARQRLYQLLFALTPDMLIRRRQLSDWHFLAHCLMNDHAAPLLGKFIHATFTRCQATPLLCVRSLEDLHSLVLD
ncbi:hypothetical protein C2E23DRAFT_853478 [Lenzites betulinus]|nr:hypothetical protein C2E23DRAFT_853478 [Lenzites betulinus]